MENRHLPILHDNIALLQLRASNESHSVGRMGGEDCLESAAPGHKYKRCI